MATQAAILALCGILPVPATARCFAARIIPSTQCQTNGAGQRRLLTGIFGWRQETAAVIDSDKFESLAGDLSGLRAVIMALVNSHPDPRALIREIDRLAELQAATANPMPVTEPFIRAQAQTTDTFRARILEILARGRR